MGGNTTTLIDRGLKQYDDYMTSQHFHIYLRPEPEGGFTVTVPALPGCITYGATLEEARTMADDAIRGYLESLQKHGESLPNDRDALLTSIEVAVRA